MILFKDFIAYCREKKPVWLIPILIALFMIAISALTAKGGATAFVYTLF